MAICCQWCDYETKAKQHLKEHMKVFIEGLDIFVIIVGIQPEINVKL